MDGGSASEDCLPATILKICPWNFPPGGLVHNQPHMPALGVWLMPDNASEGMIETFAASLVPPDNACREHARDIVKALPEHVRQFSPDRAAHKALLHTWR
jgi:hypothetical protein